MTKTAKWLTALALVAGASGALGRAATVPVDGVDGPALFARLKALEGTWVAGTAGGQQSKIVFDLTANGTVLLEHYTNPAMPGGGHMLTAYHLDGRDLILTHYCIANNQPVLRAERFDPKTGEIRFEFLRATNLSSPKAGHMRRAVYKLQDATRFTTEWSFYEAGALKMTEAETFTKVQ